MSSGVDAAERLVLDTSAFSHLRAGHEQVLERVASAEIVFLPVTVIGELCAGFELGSRARENRVALADFLSEPYVSVVPTTVEIGRRYGELFARLRQAGIPVPVNDIWIAAAAIDSAGHLLTFDSHFENIPGLSFSMLPA